MADISMIRGDTMIMYLTPYRDDSPIEFNDGDIFRLRIFDTDGELLISKDVTAAEQDEDTYAISVTLDAADTQSLEINKDTTYQWECEVELSDGTILTPFYNRTLLIKPDRITPDIRGGGE